MRLPAWLPAALLLALPLLADARPAYRRAVADLLALPTASKLNDCRTCHLPLKEGVDENDRPHNAFGLRLKELRGERKKAGKPNDIAARLSAIAEEDADGDGVANFVELIAGTFPGAGTDKPGAEAIESAKKRVPELIASLTGYRWRPFDRVERPAVPGGRDGLNPIDAFLAVEMEKRGVTPRPEAPRAVLLRRATLDLTGLPPTPDEVRTFVDDASPNAWEKVIDRLLSSPRYGERWGRHWMDVWRYSDWAGFGAQVRDSQPHIWHWRDWILESLNAGKSYDRMVREMLAADEMTPTDGDALRATGFLVRNYKLLSREKWLQDAVDHTAQAFLGLTLGCARCHDHMYDPVTMKEYYQVRAIFTPHNVRTDRLPGYADVEKNGLPRAYDGDLKAATYLLLRGDDRAPDKTALSPGVPESLGGTFSPSEIRLPKESYDPNRRAFVTQETLAERRAAIEKAKQERDAARRNMLRAVIVEAHPLRASVQHAASQRLREALALAELDVEVSVSRLSTLEAVLKVEVKDSPEARKEAGKLQRETAIREARRAVSNARLQVLNAMPGNRAALAKQLTTAEQALQKVESMKEAFAPRQVRSYPATSTGRRLAFANWITHRDNPLAARVAVNHVWLRHFGQALAPGVFDLGRNGQPPTHPALLDWLAVEFMERGWDTKALHRLILTSAAYRRHSTPDRESLARDPDNVTLWRFAPRRAEAEVVRDSLFFMAGRLDETMGGPDIPHDRGLQSNRRSVYFQHAQEKQMELMLLFDTASVSECYQRRQAIMPQQALALANSDLALSQARLTGRLLHTNAGADDERFIRLAFERLLSRPPTNAERAACVAYLKEQSSRFGATKAALDTTGAQPAGEPRLRARENLVHVLFNHHEFVTIR